MHSASIRTFFWILLLVTHTPQLMVLWNSQNSLSVQFASQGVIAFADHVNTISKDQIDHIDSTTRVHQIVNKGNSGNGDGIALNCHSGECSVNGVKIPTNNPADIFFEALKPQNWLNF